MVEAEPLTEVETVDQFEAVFRSKNGDEYKISFFQRADGLIEVKLIKSDGFTDEAGNLKTKSQPRIETTRRIIDDNFLLAKIDFSKHRFSGTPDDVISFLLTTSFANTLSNLRATPK